MTPEAAHETGKRLKQSAADAHRQRNADRRP
jgi:hypothetical protein